MKNIHISIFTLLIVAFGYAQTKEATMEWIAQKINEHGYVYRPDTEKPFYSTAKVQITNNSFIIETQQEGYPVDFIKHTTTRTSNINVNQIISAQVERFYGVEQLVTDVTHQT